MANPLPIPKDFSPETHMLGNPTDDGVLHQTRRAAGFAANLVTNGTPEDLALAEKVLDALLACQETREDDPHYGNFKWYREDDFVEDLNAVAFNLTTLIPLAIHYGDRLSKSMYDRLLDAIRLGLHEVRNLDVQVA